MGSTVISIVSEESQNDKLLQSDPSRDGHAIENEVEPIPPRSEPPFSSCSNVQTDGIEAVEISLVPVWNGVSRKIREQLTTLIYVIAISSCTGTFSVFQNILLSYFKCMTSSTSRMFLLLNMVSLKINVM